MPKREFDREEIKTMLLDIGDNLGENVEDTTHWFRCVAQTAADIVNEREGKPQKD